MRTLTVGSLFAGIGGFDLGFERAGFEIKWQVEIDPFCRAVLAKHWPDVRRYEDVRTVHGWREYDSISHSSGGCVSCLSSVDVLVGGFPCQDISVAGRGEGIDGERSGLWSEYARLIGELRPRYVVVENVSALLVRGLERVLGDLAARGYDAEWDCLPASAVGAPHQRDRVWIVAYPQRDELRNESISERGRGDSPESRNDGATEPLADAAGGIRQRATPGQAGHVALSGQDVADADSGRALQPQGRLSDERGRISDGGQDVEDSAGGRRQRRRAGRAEAASGRALGLSAGSGQDAPDADGADVEGQRLALRVFTPHAGLSRDCWWELEPNVGRVAHGVPARVDRLRGLGNAIVPQIAEWIARRIVEAEAIEAERQQADESARAI